MSYKHRKAEMKRQREVDRAVRAEERQSRIAKKFKKPAFTPLKPRESKYVETDSMRRVRELPSFQALSDPKPSMELAMSDMDMTQLEARVMAFAGTEEGAKYLKEFEARVKSKDYAAQLAPLYPKGPYQLITDPNAPKMFNKKDGGL
ncbi:hypothetical protein DLP05_077 [Stenotrophomonas phage vB_SmaS_DLP_5]|uniref:Uncharacterized protein n=1 Tax=Stenotrophomonas phage vB_SmaS_DLP_5 TaxID=2044561 RepID=A0A2D2W2I4_9CAUD|nr:hypothetical protein FDJ07_gp144 [Stenotrophomonas phage vB_SmaS_DLP_5]ATS92343.1 hypothetical protein DLP05_077 [Stenotrophomonas phage vB_SmaS_DLP_5]